MACSPNAAAAEPLARKVRALLCEALPDGGRIAVGYSGGIDSTALLALALGTNSDSSNHEYCAVHVNHDINPKATAWEAHCKRRCSSWGVPLTVCQAKVCGKTGIEEKARNARHKAWRKLDVEAVMLAHHADDQAETVLLRALRGAGMRGISSMRPVSMLPGSSKLLLRPLLDTPRSELSQILRKLRVRAISDPANTDLSINRNWLRHEVIPEASKRFPGAVTALTSMAKNSAQAEELLVQLACEDDDSAKQSGSISRKALLAKGRGRVANWLLWRLSENGVAAPKKSHLEEAVRQLCEARDGFSINFSGLRLICKRGLLNFQIAALD